MNSVDFEAFAVSIASRKSVNPKHQVPPAPTMDVLKRAASAAASAPCHADAFPVRFVAVESRERLADLFEAALPADADEEKRAKARSKAMKAPMQIAVVSKRFRFDVDRRAETENAITTGAALANFLNVLHWAGYAAKVVSGRELPLVSSLCGESEELIAFILCGTSDEALDKASGQHPERELLQVW